MNTKVPKYVKIKNTIIQKIESGCYLPGDAIPSDNELMRTLNVSKSTITQALKNLEAEGYIIRQQGKRKLCNRPFAGTGCLKSVSMPYGRKRKTILDFINR